MKVWFNRRYDGKDYAGRKIVTQRWVSEVSGSGKAFVASARTRKGAITGLRRMLGAAPGQSKVAAA